MYTKKDAYKTWYAMHDRCSKGYAKVCEEWIYYKNFEEWYMNNVYGTKQYKLQLDKDLFSKDEKLYSPDTCCMLPKSLNILLASCTSRNGLLPGVGYTKAETFIATVIRATKCKGQTFKTELEAFEYYKIEKEKIIKTAADAYSFLIPKKIYDALMEYEIKAIRGDWKKAISRSFDIYLSQTK